MTSAKSLSARSVAAFRLAILSPLRSLVRAVATGIAAPVIARKHNDGAGFFKTRSREILEVAA